jgi:hypothetical protein
MTQIEAVETVKAYITDNIAVMKGRTASDIIKVLRKVFPRKVAFYGLLQCIKRDYFKWTWVYTWNVLEGVK